MAIDICLHHYSGKDSDLDGNEIDVYMAAYWKGDRVIFYGEWAHVPDMICSQPPTNRELRNHLDFYGNPWKKPSIFEDYRRE